MEREWLSVIRSQRNTGELKEIGGSSSHYTLYARADVAGTCTEAPVPGIVAHSARTGTWHRFLTVTARRTTAENWSAGGDDD
jgi:hypothetical protein